MQVLLTGGSGMLGSAIRRLAPEEAPDWSIIAPNHEHLDLQDRRATARFFASNQVDLVVHTAARVGGIASNIAHPVAYLLDNLEMNDSVIGEACRTRVPGLLFLGSSCMYPKDLPHDLREEDLLSAPLEPTNEGYALSKITAAKLCEFVAAQEGLAFRTLIPCNLYGPGDHYEPERSHLIPAILHKLHQAKTENAGQVEIWGDGTARREFLYVDDLARFILRCTPDTLRGQPSCLNVGTGRDHSVLDYYRIGAQVTGYGGGFTFNLEAPTGMKRKLLDSKRAREFGWSSPTDLTVGMAATYEAYRAGCGR